MKHSTVVVVLLVVLLVVLALLIGERLRLSALASAASYQSTAQSPKTGGGDEGRRRAPNDQDPHGLSEAVFRRNVDVAAAAAVSGEHPPDAIAPLVVGAAKRGTTGGSSSRSAKHWTKFATWEGLAKNETAYQQYWADRAEALKYLPTDWSEVRKEAAPLLNDDREWAGLINMVNGKLKIVKKVASPLAIGEDVPPGVLAMVPAETIEELCRQPALFAFHTHPHEASSLISTLDAASAALIGYTGHYAAHAMISKDTITLYGPTPKTLTRIWDDPHPHFATLRLAFDTYGSMESLRSYDESYSVADVKQLLNNLGMNYINYPEGEFVRLQHNFRFVPWEYTDVRTIRDYLRSLEKVQRTIYAPRPPDAAQTEELPAEKHN